MKYTEVLFILTLTGLIFLGAKTLLSSVSYLKKKRQIKNEVKNTDINTLIDAENKRLSRK